MYDIIGISNSLIDLCVMVDDTFLKENSLKKGDEHLVDKEIFMYIHGQIKNPKISLGGSVSNTISSLSLLGQKVAEFGKVGIDEYGDMLINDKINNNIGNFLKKSNYPTGAVICLITPDAERTFVVYLGAAEKLLPEEIDYEILRKAKYLHITAYEYLSLHETVMQSVKFAKKNNIKISFDIGSPGIVQQNRLSFLKFIEEYVDILFANEQESYNLTKKKPVEAINQLYNITNIAIIKLGKDGSLIKYQDIIHEIPAINVNAIDTTGAGDAYAAGILYGLINNIDITKTGKIASYLASKVIKKIGARLNNINLNEIKNI
ncbi:MAG: adenosine kinase [Candidatus Woesearchaeota archaeon]